MPPKDKDDQDVSPRGHSNAAFVDIDVDELIEPNSKGQDKNAPIKDKFVKYTSDEWIPVKDLALKASQLGQKQQEVRRNDLKSENQASDDKPAVYTQVVGVVMASLTHFAVGSIVGLPGVTLPQLTDPTSEDIFLDTAQVALFGSLIHIGAIVGSLLGGVFCQRLGQRVTLLLALPLCLALWLCLSFSPSIWLVQVTRTLLGVAMGFFGAAATNYVVEIVHTSMRGRFAGFVDTARQLGFLFAYVVGSTGLSWRHVALVCGFVTTVPPFVGLLFLPNSPRWLVTRGRVEEARKALRFFRGQHYDINPELSAIVEQFERTSSSDSSFRDQLKQMGEPSVRRRLLLLAFLMFILQFTGNITIATYIVPIMQASKTPVNAYTSAMMVGGVRVVGTVTFLLLVDRVGRKSIVLVTSAVSMVCLVALGVYFHLQNLGSDLSHVSWLPITSILVFMPFVCAQEAVVCLFRGELLPTSLRAVGAAFMYLIFFLGMFASTHAYPASVATIGEQGVFYLYAISCLLLAGSVVAWVPETRGLSLEQIDDFFRGRLRKAAS